jgi:hypothetical protein
LLLGIQNNTQTKQRAKKQKTFAKLGKYNVEGSE